MIHLFIGGNAMNNLYFSTKYDTKMTENAHIMKKLGRK